MAIASPTFLNIPQELRDEIYRILIQDYEFSAMGLSWKTIAAEAPRLARHPDLSEKQKQGWMQLKPDTSVKWLEVNTWEFGDGCGEIAEFSYNQSGFRPLRALCSTCRQLREETTRTVNRESLVVMADHDVIAYDHYTLDLWEAALPDWLTLYTTELELTFRGDMSRWVQVKDALHKRIQTFKGAIGWTLKILIDEQPVDAYSDFPWQLRELIVRSYLSSLVEDAEGEARKAWEEISRRAVDRSLEPFKQVAGMRKIKVEESFGGTIVLEFTKDGDTWLQSA